MSDNDLIRRGDAKKTASGYIYNCDYMLDAINAIPAVQPTVKPLVWTQISIPKQAMQGIWWMAEAMTGNYEVHQFDGRDEIIVTLRGLGLGNPEYPTIEAAKAAAQADYEARIRSALTVTTTGKEVMPDDNDNFNARPATSPGVTAGASPDGAVLVESVQALRDAMRDNIVVNDEPHTVVLPDGSRHSGPVVDFLHALLGAQISVLDAALARVKGVM
jgi:hypothetical protein